MILRTKDLPSRGIGVPISNIELNPLTYNEVLRLSSRNQNMSSIQLLKWDFDNIVTSIKNWEALSSYDVLSIINMRKLLSITNKQKFKVNGIEYSLSDINYKLVTDDTLKIEKIRLGNYEFEVGIKSMKYFYEVLTSILDESDLPVKFVYIASFLGYQSRPKEVLSSIKNATYDEITLLEFIYRNCLGHMQVKSKEGEAVGLYESTADLFPIILENNGISQDKIIIRSELQS